VPAVAFERGDDAAARAFRRRRAHVEHLPRFLEVRRALVNARAVADLRVDAPLLRRRKAKCLQPLRRFRAAPAGIHDQVGVEPDLAGCTASAGTQAHAANPVAAAVHDQTGNLVARHDRNPLMGGDALVEHLLQQRAAAGNPRLAPAGTGRMPAALVVEGNVARAAHPHRMRLQQLLG
jgi:hypothetical protein